MAIFKIKQNKDRELRLVLFLTEADRAELLLEYGEQPKSIFKNITIKNAEEWLNKKKV